MQNKFDIAKLTVIFLYRDDNFGLLELTFYQK